MEGTISWAGLWTKEKEEAAGHGHVCISPLLPVLDSGCHYDWLLQVPAALTFPHDGLQPRIFSHTKPFFLKLILPGNFIPETGKESKTHV